MNVKYCTGCWGCWVKTPGECIIRDDSHYIFEKIINIRLVIFTSPLIMGFISSILKKTMDRMIPLLLPYIDLVKKECHHQKRYEKYPLLGLILEKTQKSLPRDVDITTDIFKRFSLNFRSKLQFTHLINDPIQETTDEINCI